MSLKKIDNLSFVSGVVLAMDNFRVLHGRTGFTGTRVLCGSYVSRSDWLDKARVLGLINWLCLLTIYVIFGRNKIVENGKIILLNSLPTIMVIDLYVISIY